MDEHDKVVFVGEYLTLENGGDSESTNRYHLRCFFVMLCHYFDPREMTRALCTPMNYTLAGCFSVWLWSLEPIRITLSNNDRRPHQSTTP